jgi:hypothetical protein
MGDDSFDMVILHIDMEYLVNLMGLSGRATSTCNTIPEGGFTSSLSSTWRRVADGSAADDSRVAAAPATVAQSNKI